MRLGVFRSKELQSEATDLRERIKHLNDMVFCQQRKVKGMIEEVRRVYLPVYILSNHIHSALLFSLFFDNMRGSHTVFKSPEREDV